MRIEGYYRRILWTSDEIQRIMERGAGDGLVRSAYKQTLLRKTCTGAFWKLKKLFWPQLTDRTQVKKLVEGTVHRTQFTLWYGVIKIKTVKNRISNKTEEGFCCFGYICAPGLGECRKLYLGEPCVPVLGHQGRRNIHRGRANCTFDLAHVQPIWDGGPGQQRLHEVMDLCLSL